MITLTDNELRVILEAIGCTLDYVNYPHTHKGTTRIRKANQKAETLLKSLTK